MSRCITHYSCQCHTNFIEQAEEIFSDLENVFKYGFDGVCVSCGIEIDGKQKHDDDCSAQKALFLMAWRNADGR